jgi:RHS repeat-associated protein
VLAQFVHTLDNVGNREARTGPGEDDLEDYTYDDTYRLTGATYPNDDETTYDYDAVGNRAAMVEVTGSGTFTTTYSYDALDRLTDLTRAGVPTAFDWDDNGNQLAKGDDTYEYDADNRMVGADVGSATSAYLYNGDGVRVRAVVTDTGTVTTDFAVDVVTDLPVVLDDRTHKYVYGLDLIAEVDDTDAPLYYLADGIGSTVGLVDDEGASQDAYSYDVFGGIRTQVAAELNNFTFTGQQQDPAAELMFLRARLYDPELGRFLGRDPLAGSCCGVLWGVSCECEGR